MQSSDWCTVEEVAAAYGVQPATVREWCRTGAIQGAIHAGRQWRIPIRYKAGSVEIKLPEQNGGGGRGGRNE